MMDAGKYTRARVEEVLTNAIRFAIKLVPNDSRKNKMIQQWPDDCSVRWEWFLSVVALAEIKLKPTVYIPSDYYDDLYLVLTKWLDSADSVIDRELLVLHACDVSMSRIGKITGMNRQTTSRRHTRALDALVWKLNH